jgi:Condensation domain
VVSQSECNICGEASGIQTLNWFHQYRLDMGVSLFTEPEILSFHLRFRSFDVRAFEAAHRHLVERHLSMRTILLEEKGKIFQRIVSVPAGYYEPSIYDIVHLLNKEDFIKKICNAGILTITKLDKGPLFKSMVFKISPEEYSFFCFLHHSICDAYSLDILQNNLVALYRGYKASSIVSMPPINITPIEISRSQNEFVEHGNGKREFDFWMSKVNVYKPLAFEQLYQCYRRYLRNHSIVDNNIDEISTGLFVNETPRNGSSEYRFLVDYNVHHSISEYAKEQSVSVFIIYSTALSLLFALLNNDEKVLLATSINDRKTDEYKMMVGHFMYKIYFQASGSTKNLSVQKLLHTNYIEFLRMCRHPMYQEKQFEQFDIPKRTLFYINYQAFSFNTEQPSVKAYPRFAYSNRSCYCFSAIISNNVHFTEFNWVFDKDVFSESMVIFLRVVFEKLLHAMVIEEKVMVSELQALSKDIVNSVAISI